MSIPTSITTALTSLELQVQAAYPLANANHSTIVAIQLNAVYLLNNIQTTLTLSNSLLDTWTAPVDGPSIAKGITNILSAAQDQENLSLMRGVVGRATSNLEQL